jgi:hypothetical protein
MTQYAIWFPSEAMQVTEEEFPQVVIDSNAAVEEMREAGVLVFAGGVDESAAPVLVGRDGSPTPGGFGDRVFDGGLTVIEVPTQEDALRWAARLAAACRCPQEVRVIA